MGTFLVFFRKLMSCCGLCMIEEEISQLPTDGSQNIPKFSTSSDFNASSMPTDNDGPHNSHWSSAEKKAKVHISDVSVKEVLSAESPSGCFQRNSLQSPGINYDDESSKDILICPQKTVTEPDSVTLKSKKKASKKHGKTMKIHLSFKKNEQLTREPSASSSSDPHSSNSTTPISSNANAVSVPSSQLSLSSADGYVVSEKDFSPNLLGSRKTPPAPQKVISVIDAKQKEVKPLGDSEPQKKYDASSAMAMVMGKTIQDYTKSQKILLVGEGDFSFSLCLAEAFGVATNMVATSLDSKEYLTRYYKDALTNICLLEKRGCTVLNEVDATAMSNDSRITGFSFDRIIFNFPHCGDFSGSEEALRDNQSLIRSFMLNSVKLMKEDCEIHIRHKTSGFFRKWKVKLLGFEAGLKFFEEIRLDVHAFEGYNAKYGFEGGKYTSDDNFDSQPSRTYKFAFHEYVKKLRRQKRELNAEIRNGSSATTGIST